MNRYQVEEYVLTLVLPVVRSLLNRVVDFVDDLYAGVVLKGQYRLSYLKLLKSLESVENAVE